LRKGWFVSVRMRDAESFNTPLCGDALNWAGINPALHKRLSFTA
jgi:hypothetical protein